MIFYLGTHVPSFLGKTSIPLFLSFQSLKKRRTLKPGRWAVDSGGFTELNKNGAWTIPARHYADRLWELSQHAGMPDFAAIQDWMCEPSVVAKTGLSIGEHQRRTVQSYIELMEIEPRLPWAPVLQGWEEADYLAHIDQYARAGVELRALPVVGIGSICRRQATRGAEGVIRAVAAEGIRLHGFGFKMLGLRMVHDVIHSADSMAWSFAARYNPVRLEGHTHINCANCLEYAEQWYRGVARQIPFDDQPMAA